MVKTTQAHYSVEGPEADDEAAVGSPVLGGGVAIEVDKTDPGEVSASGDAAFLRTDMNRRLLVNPVHPNYFNVKTSITTVDADTEVVPAKTGMRAHITDIIISTKQTAAIGSFTLTNDGGTAILGPIEVVDQVPFIANFNTPLVNETANNKVEMDKTAGEDDWEVYLAGYYAP